MKFLVLLESFETITDDGEVQEMRRRIGEKVEELEASGRVLEKGVFADRRGAFFLMEADSGAELARLFYPAHDFSRIDARPVYSFQELRALFEEGT